jgi:hypothetical protein
MPSDRCPDCNALIMHHGRGDGDLVMGGSPLDHHYIYERDEDGHMTGGRRRCPTMLARSLQIEVEVFGGERAFVHATRHPVKECNGVSMIPLIPRWCGESLPNVHERRYMQQRSYA